MDLDPETSQPPPTSMEALLESALDTACVAWDERRRVVFFTAGAERMYGLPRSAVVYRTWPQVRREGLPLPVIERAARVEGAWRAEERRWRSDGTPFLARCTVRTVESGTGGSLFVEVSEDVSSRRRSEGLLRASEARLSRLLDASSDGLLVFDPEGRLQFANTAARRLAGWPDPAPLGCPWDDLGLETGPHAAAVRPVLRVLRTGETWTGELTLRRPEAAPVDVQAKAHPLLEGGELAGVVIGLTDLRPVREAAEQRRAREWLASLSRRLLEAQEAERRALARELHDEVGQVLTGLREALRGGATDAALGLTEHLIARVRDLSLDLRPALLDDLGLLPALFWLCDRTRTLTGLKVTLVHAGLHRRFPAEWETAAYRITQEALTNAARHSGAAAAEVRVRVEDGALRLEIRDAGRGFDAREPRAGAGLTGIRERVALFGGEMDLEARPGEGVRIRVALPLLEDGTG